MVPARQIGRALLASTFLAALSLTPASDGKDDEGAPKAEARKFIENLPPTVNPLPAIDRSAQRPAIMKQLAAGPPWISLGPAPIPNGQTENRTDPVSGRVTAIVIDPKNAGIVYVGTAQGGVYRSLNAGDSWVQLMDNAAPGSAGTPLAIGSLALDPTNANTLLVGTGEGNFSADSYFGCGLYIITHANTVAPTVNGPYNQRSDDVDVFTGRSIVSIAVDPKNRNNVFLATSTGVAGIVPDVYSVMPPRGLYRSNNAFAGVEGTGRPIFTRIAVERTETNALVTSVVIDPDNANNLVCALYGQNGLRTGGIYRTTNALDPTPTFTQTLPLADGTNAKLALSKVGEQTTVYVATEEGEPDGRLYRSTDGGVTFTYMPAADGFAGEQGFYNIAVAADPTNPEKVYVGGQLGRNIFLYSDDGGKTFRSSVTGLHADAHAIAIAPSDRAVIYHGNDGGIWRSTNSGLNWTSLNNSTFSATQFQALAVHPSDRNFSIGGTQDNGTPMLRPDGTFFRTDFGDGGYSLIDQNASDTFNVTMYHTYFNVTRGIIGTARVLRVDCATDGEWSFHGAFSGSIEGPYCDGSFDTRNGISITDDVNFYAPQTLGPGNPNTWYFGTDKLYRSADRADNAAPVSQTFNGPISAIAISPQDDRVRVIGLNDGRVFATVAGSTTLTQVAGPGASNGTSNTPAVGVGRIAIDPNNSSVVYLCFNGFGTKENPIAHVWKTTNLRAPNVTFVPVSNGLPDLPVNAIAIDRVAVSESVTTDIYVGTDQGVYFSGDAGASWVLYGQSLPRVAVFGLEIQSPSRVLRAATHGRGLYETSTVSTATPTPTPTPEPVTDPSTKLVNVSTRGLVRSGAEVMIAGFVIQGDDTKRLILRGIGPTMAKSGVFDAIYNPRLTVYDASGTAIAFNDNYSDASIEDRAVVAANALTPADDRESVIVISLAPGAYTCILQGTTAGSALVEAYDITRTRTNRLINISTRLKVEAGDKGAAIAGFIIATPDSQPITPQRVAIRAVGASLQQQGVGGALADPTLEIYRGGQRILTNDNWKTNSPSVQEELRAAGIAPRDEKEPALITTLEPGAYTAVIRGKDNTIGIAVAEVYRLGP